MTIKELVLGQVHLNQMLSHGHCKSTTAYPLQIVRIHDLLKHSFSQLHTQQQKGEFNKI